MSAAGNRRKPKVKRDRSTAVSEPANETDAQLDDRAEAVPDDGAELDSVAAETSELESVAPGAEAHADAVGRGTAPSAVATEDQDPAENQGDDSVAHPISQIAPPLGDGELSRSRVKQALESLIFVSDRIVTAVQLARSIKVRVTLVRELIAEIMQEYVGRGIELHEVAGGYQFRSASACAPFVREFVAQKPVRLTRAQLETLALVGYRQPITRPEIDDVRGVDSGSAMRVLLERNLIKMLGRKDEPGRPLLYGTTSHFLEFFGMRSLKDLPTLREFTELSEENRALFKQKTGEEFGDGDAALAAAEAARADEEAAAHISDEDLAALAAEAAREELEGLDDAKAVEDLRNETLAETVDDLGENEGSGADLE